jgi:bacillithiol biosynthesis deacetylase BshB1
MKLDVLVLAAHPDDAELACGGTIASLTNKGYMVGIVDLTRGEMGTRGTPELRDKESALAAEILQLTIRENLCLPDVYFQNIAEHQLKVIQAIRTYQPDIVIGNAIEDRHPDHGKGAVLINDACFLAGLARISTKNSSGELQKPHRPRLLLHMIQDRYIQPDMVVDVSPFWAIKMQAIKAYGSQFYNPESTEPETYISQPGFLQFIEARGREMGHHIGVQYGEGFTCARVLGVDNLMHLI